MRYEVQHWTLCDGWVNTWTDIGPDDSEIPTTFETEAEAESALQDFLDDWEAEFVSRASEYKYSRDEFRIVKVKP